MPLLRFIWIALLAVEAFSTPSAAAADPLDLYGERILFDIVRKGQVIGSHTVSLRGDGAAVETRSEVRIEIDVLIFTAFRYEYDSEAVWRDGQLHHLTVDLDDDGQKSLLTAKRDSSGMEISRNGLKARVDAPLYPTEHWNAGVLGERRVLNTLTGKVNDVQIQEVAREYVATEHGDVPATHYRYVGDLDAEVWYDDHGRWVKMRFKGRDGSTIEYACRECQGGVGGAT